VEASWFSLGGIGMGFSVFKRWAFLAFCGALIPACQIATKYPQELARNQLDPDRYGQIEARSKVHIVFLNGFDPIDSGHFQDLHNHIREAGFPSTYYGWGWNVQTLADWMKKLPDESEAARVVVITHGAGAVGARHLAKGLAKGGRAIDMLVMIAPPPSPDGALLPEVVGDTLSILPGNSLEYSVVSEGTLIIPGANHFDTCSNDCTRDYLTEMLEGFVNQVLEENPNLNKGMPGQADPKSDEWDYLRSKVDGPNGKEQPKQDAPKKIEPPKKPDGPKKPDAPGGLITRR